MIAYDLSARAAREALRPVSHVVDVSDDEVIERFSRVVWNHLTEPGDGVAGRLIASVGAREALDAVLSDAMSGPIAGLTARELAEGRKRWRPRLGAESVAFSIGLAARAGVRLVTPPDPEWPEQLSDLGAHAPICLWVRGRTASLTRLRPSVAVVGARAATSYGEHMAVELSADLATGGVPVVSGAAYGIDGAAHRAVLATGGLTVALLAGGVDRPYPAGHAHLLDRVAATGAIASEVPCGSAPTKWRFLQRNRLIAALAEAVVVVEAGWRSGSLNTAGHAVTLGRALGAVPGPVTSAASAGCHRLLREFGAVCVTGGDDVREMLGHPVPPSAADAAGPGEARPRTDDRSRVRDALSMRAWLSVDEVARRSGMAVDEAEGMLGLLHLAGEAETDAGGWRRASR